MLDYTGKFRNSGSEPFPFSTLVNQDHPCWKPSHYIPGRRVGLLNSRDLPWESYRGAWMVHTRTWWKEIQILSYTFSFIAKATVVYKQIRTRKMYPAPSQLHSKKCGLAGRSCRSCTLCIFLCLGKKAFLLFISHSLCHCSCLSSFLSPSLLSSLSPHTYFRFLL